MDIYKILIILSIVSINILFFIVGFLYCSLFYKNISSSEIFSTKSIKEKNKTKIDIDDKKIITQIKTEGLEKKYQNIAESQKSDENITSSINKLKNMKG
jgi:hypothetical protein